MPTQWSEAEQVPLGCIAPHKKEMAPTFAERRHVVMPPYESVRHPVRRAG